MNVQTRIADVGRKLILRNTCDLDVGTTPENTVYLAKSLTQSLIDSTTGLVKFVEPLDAWTSITITKLESSVVYFATIATERLGTCKTSLPFSALLLNTLKQGDK